MRRFRTWLSPGTVLGFMALVIALGGTGYAATGNGHHATDAAKRKKKSHTLTSSQVKKIADDEIKKLAPTLSVAKAGSATSATTANTATTANSAKIATNILSANVRADGTMLGSIPAGATSTRTNVGTYSVSFGRAINGCTIAAAAANNSGPQVAFTAVGVIDANTLDVFTRDPTNTVVDEPFYIQAICPA
jgi:hypothetical protein